MAAPLSANPAFGQADLSNCEREQIHLAASIQPHGALLHVRERDLRVVQASANASAFLGIAKEVVGQDLEPIAGDLARILRPHLDQPLEQVPVALRCHFGVPRDVYDCLVHRLHGGGLVIELERAGQSVDLSRHVEGALPIILAAASVPALCDDTARIFKDLTGFDRVMVYRFDDEGHGEVFSEQRNADLEPFLGNRYPASDIPQIARRLYERSRVRVLVDVDYTPVPLVPRLSPLTGADLDMSLCILRSSSPIHVQYLKNMGVSATLVVSLMVAGKLWGLVSCHHYSRRLVPFEVRAVCELLAETIATRIVALESFAQAQAELSVRRLEQHMIEAISRDGDWRTALFDSSRSLLRPLEATGAALLFEGNILSTGEVPGTQELREISKWLESKPRSSVFQTASLGLDEPAFLPLAAVASGLVATPVSNTAGEYLIWLRGERIRKVTWGGDPYKAVIIGDNPADLSPRRSFAQWHQVVEHTSDPWTPADLTAARLIGDTVSDVVLQFRSVRLLIAQDQLDNVSTQVRLSEQPVLIADPSGRILLSNPSFQEMIQAAPTELHWVEDLVSLFAEPAKVRRRLRDVVRHHRTWRGEVTLSNDRGPERPLLVRADPVFSSPGRVLGFVLLFSDLTERKAAEAARRRFQDGLVEGPPIQPARFNSRSDVLFRNLLSTVVENAQIAALEITDGAETARMPEMLDSVRASVSRTAEVLRHLIDHADGSAQDER